MNKHRLFAIFATTVFLISGFIALDNFIGGGTQISATSNHATTSSGAALFGAASQ